MSHIPPKVHATIINTILRVLVRAVQLWHAYPKRICICRSFLRTIVAFRTNQHLSILQGWRMQALTSDTLH
jgi:hypothetical protein